MNKILVTGTDGLVGSALKRISQHNENWIFINKSQCNLLNKEETIALFQQVSPSCVVHMAGVVPGFYNIDRVATFSQNVQINENVLAAAHQANVPKMLVGLSVNMFGDKPSKLPLDESMIFEGHITGPFAGYGYSKRMLELQCQNYNQQYGRQYFGIIPCNIYGLNDNIKSGRLIPNLIQKFLEAQKNQTEVVINGTGKPLRQFINSFDLAIIIQKLIDKYQDTKPIICCPTDEISIAELAKLIAKVTGFKGEIKFDDSKPDGVFQKTMSNQYLKQILKYPDYIRDLKMTSLANGLNEVVASMKNI